MFLYPFIFGFILHYINICIQRFFGTYELYTILLNRRAIYEKCERKSNNAQTKTSDGIVYSKIRTLSYSPTWVKNVWEGLVLYRTFFS